MGLLLGIVVLVITGFVVWKTIKRFSDNGNNDVYNDDKSKKSKSKK